MVALLADVRTLSPWWERWPGWWADQQRQVRRRWGKGTGFTLESAGHHATWTGEIRLQDGSREAAQVIWGPATPFFAPRIVFPGCLSAFHQLNDGSVCLLSPVDPVNGWEGVIDIEAYDTDGHEIQLQPGFKLALLGRETGMDYWEAAAREPGPGTVSEPAGWALVAAGLGLLGWRRRQR